MAGESESEFEERMLLKDTSVTLLFGEFRNLEEVGYSQNKVLCSFFVFLVCDLERDLFLNSSLLGWS